MLRRPRLDADRPLLPVALEDTVNQSGPIVSHIGVAVRDLESAAAFYRDVLGIEPERPETADGATILHVPIGAIDIELLMPERADSPIARFLERRGPGIHHICFKVADLDRAMARCRELGYRLVDQEPRPGAEGRHVAFLHPHSTAGILLELTD